MDVDGIVVLFYHVGTHWSDEICEKAVRKCYHSLSKYMDSVYIVPLLVKAGHLSPEQVSQILSCQTKTERALQLLALLHGSGKTAYQGLFKALKEETEHEPHQELLQELERTCECKYFSMNVSHNIKLLRHPLNPMYFKTHVCAYPYNNNTHV